MTDFDLDNLGGPAGYKAAPDQPKPPVIGSPEPGPELTRPKSPLDQAYERWRMTRAPDDMGKVLRAAQPTLDAAATSYNANSESLRAKARLIAARAIEKYDPKNEASLKTWLTTNLQELQRHVGSASPIKVPERIRLDHIRLERIGDEFEANEGRRPTHTELAELSGLPTKRIRQVYGLSKPVVTESQILAGSADDDPVLPGVENDSLQNIWAEYVYHDLDDTDRAIYDMTVGRSGQEKMPVAAIAKVLGLNPGTVSRRAHKIADRLNEGIALEAEQ